MSLSLDAFLPAVQSWFRDAFGQPTPPQSEGWPAIQRGEHTLILSPTGSGKTLAAFLWAINEIYRELDESGEESPENEKGVRLLYISPLKALNNDVERNLRAPLAGIRRVAKEQGAPLPRLEVAVRTGDTPQSARRRMVKHPPRILITTPESLYLLLTSPVARNMFRTVHTVILDEIHTLVGNKRGVHLAISLERVVELVKGPIQRIGLSATQRPLDEVARFLGGFQAQADGDELISHVSPVTRPVTVVDVGMIKPMDIRVITAVEDFRDLPGGSIWPAIIPQAMDLIEKHHTTLLFANSRRQAERTADRLNDLYLARQGGQADGPEAMMEGGAVKGIGFQGIGAVGGPFKTHHGSVSREARYQLEQALKDGRLPALVGTSSLELGIDIGSVDLVIQFQSPKGVARGLQRVGRSGHLVGQTSAGRFFPTHREDLLESAAIVRSMLAGDVEPAYTPQNSLDVLAQQVVAMVSVQDWDVPTLFALVRRAYPYHKLTPTLFHSVLDMLSGRYPSTSFRELRPRIAWDRVHNRLTALPGSRILAIRNGGTIPDRGTFAAYLPDRKTRLGELDEEFIFETRPGDVFTLGASTWRVQEVTDDRVIVTPAPGYLPRMPFWKGDAPRRDYHLGTIYGRFRRELAERLQAIESADKAEQADLEKDTLNWLQEECKLDIHSARNAMTYVWRQLEALDAISSDKTVIAEVFTDPLGDLRMVLHSCFGARVNGPWALALAHAYRQAFGTQPEVMVSDDGILFRFLEAEHEPPLDLIRQMGPTEARERILAELPNSAVFGAQFRMNAARALLLPATRGSQKRTPFWLQRLRAKDLLSVAKGFEDFPIIAETYRNCLRDVLDLTHLEDLLRDIQSGEVEVIAAETVVPSPVAGSLLFDFISQYMYESDQPKAERQMQTLMMGRELLSQLLDEASLPDLLRPEAVRDVGTQLQHLADGTRARTPDELATVFLALGDLSVKEAAERCDGDGAAWVKELATSGRLLPLVFTDERRYVLFEQADTYRAAFPPLPKTGENKEAQSEAFRDILRRVLSTHGPLTRAWLLNRYPWQADWLDDALETLVENGEIVTGAISATESTSPEFCDRRNLERIHRQTLSILRKEVQAVTVYAYADFVTRWQHIHPAERLSGPGSLVRLLQQMRGVPAPGAIWEQDLLPLRLEEYVPAELETLCGQGDVVWVGLGVKDPRRSQVRFLFRGEGNIFLAAQADDLNLSPTANEVLAFLQSEGASFFADLEEGTQLNSHDLSAALAELVMAGLATNDTIESLRGILAWNVDQDAPERRPLSSLEAELTAWRQEQGPAPNVIGRSSEGLRKRRRPGRQQLHAAKRTVAHRLERKAPTRWPGRWSLVHRIGVWGKELPFEERLARQARQLLQCYGIVTRESVRAWESGGAESKGNSGLGWASLYVQFQRMEMRGEVRRGYFVEGLPGIQFALPEAVERLREWNSSEASGAEDLVLLNACDPANLFGPALSNSEEQEHDPARFTRIPANYVVLLRGRPVLLLETGGQRLTTLPSLPSATLKQALKLTMEHLSSHKRHLIFLQCNGETILDSPAAALLEEVGFRREALAYVLD